ncbi:hypothetical protein P3X46_003159 [Hevea brasiliensis]|uniref:Uncharacterized protein n=1 Tax=Hevea brasiliensis TaxID=3981 RepID=A0ABQ9N7S6_HEVBR|nr:hypothetical protein P3X46_003159 [Hevea brasiliensis]
MHNTTQQQMGQHYANHAYPDREWQASKGPLSLTQTTRPTKLIRPSLMPPT